MSNNVVAPAELLQDEQEEQQQQGEKKRVTTTKLEIPVDMARDIMVEESDFFYPFLILSFALVCFENILVAFRPTGLGYLLQIIVLILSTVLFFFGLCLTANNFPEDEELRGANGRYIGIGYITKLTLMFDGEVQIEAAALILGWACIFISPGSKCLHLN